MTTEEIVKKIEELELQIKREQAVTACQNLMGHYGIVHNQRNMHKHLKDFALTMPDVSFGDAVGAEALRKQFCETWYLSEEASKGIFLCHYLTNPVVTVADDCQTARGVWWSPGLEIKPNPTVPGEYVASWAFMMYATDFIVENGEWKIWHLHILPVTKCKYEDGPVYGTPHFWAKKVIGNPHAPAYSNPYSTTYTQKSVPAYPNPYKTWDGDGLWFTREENC